MIISDKYSHLQWKRAISAIIKQSTIDLQAVLIVKEDNPQFEYQIWHYLKVRYDCVYLRIGAAQTMTYIYEEILSQLTSKNRKIFEPAHDRTIAKIIAIVQRRKSRILFVIDNCVKLSKDAIGYLVGLIIHTIRKVQFVFITTEEKLKMLMANVGSSYLGGLLFETLLKGYQISHNV